MPVNGRGEVGAEQDQVPGEVDPGQQYDHFCQGTINDLVLGELGGKISIQANGHQLPDRSDQKGTNESGSPL